MSLYQRFRDVARAPASVGLEELHVIQNVRLRRRGHRVMKRRFVCDASSRDGGAEFVRVAIFPELCGPVPYRVSYGVANETREHEHPPKRFSAPKLYLPNAFRFSDWPGLQTRPSGLPMRRVAPDVIRVSRTGGCRSSDGYHRDVDASSATLIDDGRTRRQSWCDPGCLVSHCNEAQGPR